MATCWTRYTDVKFIGEKSIFFSCTSLFLLQKNTLKIWIFIVFFTSKIPFGGYFQWNACALFQKICSWIRYINAKFIRSKSIISIALLRFCFRIKPEYLNFYSILSLKDHLVASFNERHGPSSRKNVAEQGMIMPN